MTLARRLSSYLVGASLLLVASGCSTTLVQYLPAGDATTCDAAWPGIWKTTSTSDGKSESAWMEISADCKQLTFTDEEKTTVEKKSLTLISSATGDYLSILDADRKFECIGKATSGSDCGFPLLRYRREGDEIRLYQADHLVIHDAIARGDVTGLTQVDEPPAADGPKPGGPKKTLPSKVGSDSAMAKTSFQNLITGTPEQIAEILAEHPEYFEIKPWLVLHRETGDTRPKHPAKKP